MENSKKTSVFCIFILKRKTHVTYKTFISARKDSDLNMQHVDRFYYV